jgi:hypothetical protein
MNYMRRPQTICVAPPRVKVVHRPVYHDVIHVQPCHTHVVNTRINCHKFVPTYSCSSEYQCKDVYSGGCRTC